VPLYRVCWKGRNKSTCNLGALWPQYGVVGRWNCGSRHLLDWIVHALRDDLQHFCERVELCGGPLLWECSALEWASRLPIDVEVRYKMRKKKLHRGQTLVNEMDIIYANAHIPEL